MQTFASPDRPHASSPTSSPPPAALCTVSALNHTCASVSTAPSPGVLPCPFLDTGASPSEGAQPVCHGPSTLTQKLPPKGLAEEL
ncbi:hypothetical protein ABTM16_19045, partial [Acinetobacter baumannii]